MRLLLLLCCVLALSAADYYVNTGGSDSAAGTLAAPWKTVSKVNSRSFNAGDRIFFAAGQTFTDAGLYITTNYAGTAASPVVIGSYGSGRATLQPPANANAIYVYNVAGLHLKELILVGPGLALSDTNQKRGVFAYCDLAGGTKLTGMTIENLDISGFHTGITIGAWHSSYSGFKDVLVTGCVLHDNLAEGFTSYGYTPSSATQQSHANLQVVDCEATRNYGDPTLANPSAEHSGSGIIMSGTKGGLIDRCYAHHNGGGAGDNAGGGPVGIWTYASDSVVIQNCLVHDQKTTAGSADGGGFDIDGGATNALVQYCYSYRNDGPGFLTCEYTGASPLQNATWRYNISWGDGRNTAKGMAAGFHFYSGENTAAELQNVDIYNNLVYTENATGGPCVRYQSGPMAGIRFRNNLFVVKGGERFVQVASNTANFSFLGNLYWSVDANWAGGWSWAGTTYASLAAWRAATGTPEVLSGANLGVQADPLLASVIAGAQPTSVAAMQTMTAFKLLAGSPAIDAGQDLRTAPFGSLAVGARDFWNGATPVNGAFDIGPHEVADPSLGTVSPASGPAAGGTTVTLTGTNLSGTTGVAFGGVAATSVTVVGATQVTCVTPAHAAGTVDVVLATGAGSATATAAFTYTAAGAPTLTAVSPASGSTAGGTTVTLTGTNLTGATGVTFGGTAATGVTVVSATQATCVTPAHAAGAANVVITAPGGSATSVGGYTFVVPAPTLSAVSPANGSTAGGTTVTLTGMNLTGATAVTFGGMAATAVTVVSATQVTCVTPARAAGTVSVAVTTPSGTASSAGAYTFVVPAPTLTTVSPANGPTAGGTTVTLTGTNLTGATGVTFGGTAATGVTVVSATQVTCVTPARAAGTVSVAVTTPGGTATSVGAYVYVDMAGAPHLVSVAPPGGTTAGGTAVVLTGTDFTGTTAVTFGGVAASSVVEVDPTTVTCVAPPHAAGAVDVVIAAAGGSAVLAGGYTYSLPAPAVGALSPASGTVDGGTTVTLTGMNLTGATAVTFGGMAATAVTVASATQVTCVTPAAAAGTVDVVVTTPGGSATAVGAFTFAHLPPTLTAVSPGAGSTAGGTTVTLTGTQLSGVTGVTFAGTAATAVVVISPTEIACTVPAHAAGTVDVAVTTPGGSATAVGAYAYVAAPAPTLTAVSPGSGPAAGGTTVTLTGTNLTGATGVTFGGAAATGVTVVSATQVTCTAPAHASGTVSVAVTTPGGTVSLAGGFVFIVPAPTLTAMSPGSGPMAGGTAVTLTGTNLTGATVVTFGGAAATGVTVVGATQVTCTAPAHAAGTVDVMVTTAGGTATLVGAYAYAGPAAPTLAAISPASGDTAGGTVVTLTGTNLTGTTAVTFDGVAATGVATVSAIQVSCTVPAHAAGAIDVEVTAPGGAATLAGGFTYTALPPPPVSSGRPLQPAGTATGACGAGGVVGLLLALAMPGLRRRQR